MREIQVFIASSVREFERERLEVSPFLEMLNSIYARLDVQLKWNRPETQIGVLRMGGSQKMLDGFIESCDVFALIVGAHVGEHTEHEFGIALERFRASGGVEPLILPCFLKDKLTGELSEESKAFLTRIRKDLDIGAQYIDPIDNFDAALNRLQMVLAEFAVRVGDLNDAEADMRRAREHIADRIHDLQTNIAHLKATPMSQETIAQITLAYAEIWRLVREYKIEPNALLDYMEFMGKQHIYGEAIDAGKWLEGFYQIEPPSEKTWAMLKNRLGICYAKNNQHGQAERCYRKELEINRRLAEKDSTYQSSVGLTCNNLGLLLTDTNRMEEAEACYREALELHRRLSEKDSCYLPDVAATCNNLGNLLKNMSRMEEAEVHYREALEIYERLARKDSTYLSYVALTCNNLAALLHCTNRTKKAELRYWKALKIYRQLAETNPSAYLPNIAGICNNLGTLYTTVNQIKNAEDYYWEALQIRCQLADINPNAYLPDVAMTCNNLGNLLKGTGRMNEAEEFYREALEIRLWLASVNPNAYLPNVAGTYNNLGNLLTDTNRMDEAERCYQEALEIYKRFANANPDTYLPNVARICYNLGLFEYERSGWYAAKQYFQESLSLCEQFPHLAKYAQWCRDRLVELQDD